MRVTYYPGGAHLLLAVCGYNLSRFMMPIAATGERVRAGLRTVGRAALPTMAWVAAGIVAFGAYDLRTLLLVNNYLGPEHHRGDHWHFWFIEVFVHLVIAITVLLAIPAVRRLERRRPYEFALGVLAVTLVFRYGIVEVGTHTNLRFRTHGVAWFFALGWLVQRSGSRLQRALTSAICVAVIPGFFGSPATRVVHRHLPGGAAVVAGGARTPTRRRTDRARVGREHVDPDHPLHRVAGVDACGRAAERPTRPRSPPASSPGSCSGPPASLPPRWSAGADSRRSASGRSASAVMVRRHSTVVRMT